MDFLIRADWYAAEAAADHIKVTQARVLQAFRRSKRMQFSSARSFRAFLRRTGQTRSDVLFRFRIHLTYTALLRKLGVSSGMLYRRLERTYRPQTLCARYYAIPECAS